VAWAPHRPADYSASIVTSSTSWNVVSPPQDLLDAVIAHGSEPLGEGGVLEVMIVVPRAINSRVASSITYSS